MFNFLKPKYTILKYGKFFVVKKTRWWGYTNYLDTNSVKYQYWSKNQIEYCLFYSEESAETAIDKDIEWENL